MWRRTGWHRGIGGVLFATSGVHSVATTTTPISAASSEALNSSGVAVVTPQNTDDDVCELYPTTPLRLRLVQVLNRHGLRTPTTSLPGDKNEWRCEYEQLSFLAREGVDSTATTQVDKAADSNAELKRNTSTLVLHSEETAGSQIDSGYLYRRIFLSGKQDLYGNCHRGQLTTLGLGQMRELGEGMRRRYVGHLGFLPSIYEPSNVFIRSTQSNRTFESAQALMWGLYPAPHTRPAGMAGIIVIGMVESAKENLFPRSGCKRLTNLYAKRKETPEYKQHTEDIKKEKQELEALLGRNFDSWSGLNSTLKSMRAHGFVFPKGLTGEHLKRVAHEANWDTTFKFQHPLRSRLGIGRFIGDFVERMEATVQKKDNVRFVLYSAHDNSLSPFLNAFGAFDNKQPRMASAVVVELYEDAKGKYWVRFMYKNKDRLLHDEWKDQDEPKPSKEVVEAQRLAALREVVIKTEIPRSEGGDKKHKRQELEGGATLLRQEEQILCSYERFMQLAKGMIPEDYEAECKEEEKEKKKPKEEEEKKKGEEEREKGQTKEEELEKKKAKAEIVKEEEAVNVV